MTTYIARFKASHENFAQEQYSCITWKQEGDEIDIVMLKGLIRHTTACHFFKMFTEENVNPDDIIVQIEKFEKMN